MLVSFVGRQSYPQMLLGVASVALIGLDLNCFAPNGWISRLEFYR